MYRIFEIVEKKRDLYTPIKDDGIPLSDFSAAIQRGLGCVAVVADCAHSLGASRVVDRTERVCYLRLLVGTVEE